jgi:hypothetical protein
MTMPLVDYRGKITAEAHAVLEGKSRHEGRDMAEIVREILHAWALSKVDEHRLIGKSLSVAGFEGMLVDRRGLD